MSEAISNTYLKIEEVMRKAGRPLAGFEFEKVNIVTATGYPNGREYVGCTQSALERRAWKRSRHAALLVLAIIPLLTGCATPTPRNEPLNCVGKVVMENDSDSYFPHEAWLPCWRLCIRNRDSSGDHVLVAEPIHSTKECP